jgi:hypothetical protein
MVGCAGIDGKGHDATDAFCLVVVEETRAICGVMI